MEAETLLVEYVIESYARKAEKNITGVNKKTPQLLRNTPSPQSKLFGLSCFRNLANCRNSGVVAPG